MHLGRLDIYKSSSVTTDSIKDCIEFGMLKCCKVSDMIWFIKLNSYGKYTNYARLTV